jgi:hypothetical protein
LNEFFADFVLVMKLAVARSLSGCGIFVSWQALKPVRFLDQLRSSRQAPIDEGQRLDNGNDQDDGTCRPVVQRK